MVARSTQVRTSKNGIDLIKRFEGLELKAYKDAAGIWTIGYGHTGPDVFEGLQIPEQQADLLLAADLEARENLLSGFCIINDIDLNQNEFDALISFIYNIGWEAFRHESTVAKRLVAKKPRHQVADAITWWNKATINGEKVELLGLTRRRNEERILFLTEPEKSITNRTMGVSPDFENHPIRKYMTKQISLCDK